MTKDCTSEGHEAAAIGKPCGDVCRDYLVPQEKPSLAVTWSIRDTGAVTHLGQPQVLNLSAERSRELTHVMQRHPEC